MTIGTAEATVAKLADHFEEPSQVAANDAAVIPLRKEGHIVEVPKYPIYDLGLPADEQHALMMVAIARNWLNQHNIEAEVFRASSDTLRISFDGTRSYIKFVEAYQVGELDDEFWRSFDKRWDPHKPSAQPTASLQDADSPHAFP